MSFQGQYQSCRFHVLNKTYCGRCHASYLYWRHLMSATITFTGPLALTSSIMKTLETHNWTAPAVVQPHLDSLQFQAQSRSIMPFSTCSTKPKLNVWCHNSSYPKLATRVADPFCVWTSESQVRGSALMSHFEVWLISYVYIRKISWSDKNI